MSAERYPPATWKGDGVTAGSYQAGVPWRVVLHTTETEGVPGYQSGQVAPHLTYDPRTRKWVQHTDLSVAARALRNLDGGVQTNRARALQVEIVCYSAKSVADAQPAERLWVGALPQTAYDDLGDFCAWAAEHYGIVERWPGRTALSYAQANAPGFRMGSSTWITFDGVCAHQHVPENDHWDTGALDFPRLLEAMMSTWKSRDGYTYVTDDWAPHDKGIKFVIDAGLMVGARDEATKTGEFNAPDPLKRGEFATVLKRFTDDAGLSTEIDD